MKQLKNDMLFAKDTNNTPEMTEAAAEDESVDMPDPDAELLSRFREDDVEPDNESDELDTAEKEEETQQLINNLREEISALKLEIDALEQFKKNQDRILNELTEFAALFPEIAVDEIPEDVWEAVRKGGALTASYALYEKRKAAEAIRIANINAKNASRSPGAAGTNTAGEYFSPDDVRRMSRAEVHANYSKIKESMKKWM